jgi:hypothetical protein
LKRILIVLIPLALLASLTLCRNASAALPPPQLKAKFSSIAPEIDGILRSAEWNDTTKYVTTLTNGTIDIDAWLYVKHNATHIHLGLVIWSYENLDEVIVAFDEGDDGSHGSGSRDHTLTPLQEDIKTVTRDHTLLDGYYNLTWQAKNTEIDFDADLIHEIEHTTAPWEIEYWEGIGWVDDHKECEFSIPFVGNDAGTSDVSDLSCNVTDIVGIKFQCYYPPSDNYYFPSGDKTQISTYADLSFPMPLIESCSSSGTEKNSFNLYEDVRASGSGFLPNVTYSFYIVNDVEIWTDGMPIPERVSGTATSITSDSDGTVLPVIVWSDPSTVGAYDILVDVNENGFYDEGIDALDSNDVEVTAGFVIPEFPVLSVSLLFQLAVFAAMVFVKKHKH